MDRDIAKFIREDVHNIKEVLEEYTSLHNVFVKPTSEETEDGAKVTLTVTSDEGDTECSFEYFVDGEDVYISEPVYDVAQNIANMILNSDTSITSATNIFAAEGDADSFDNDDYGWDDEGSDGGKGEEGVNDSLDDIADNVEDIQEEINDVEEDRVNIELDNNITDHYIAECEKCKGIFISAMTESDQIVDSIHGTCPICEEESDQYLLWIIKEAKK